ncbi:hypothetical protein NE237_002027 [Protea cynaroides]|uniref:Transcription repressor n=1 Tax=Protea cynaroides TaxID=273540 RepID=A0A9Q0KV34_9MAGN|nr:hypothetical protein NE237_002027 [Protea cynaroides]
MQRNQQKGCGIFCCDCRLSISSSEEVEEGSNSDTYVPPPLSSLAHAMVQERLEQLIKEREVEESNRRRKNKGRMVDGGTKCIMMVAMDKYSFDPREDFRKSMVEMIMANRLEEPKELRCLLNCYVSMNPEYRAIILEVRINHLALNTALQVCLAFSSFLFLSGLVDFGAAAEQKTGVVYGPNYSWWRDPLW